MKKVVKQIIYYDDNTSVTLNKTNEKFWRVKHDKEIPKGIWRRNLPEVHPLYVNHHSPFQKWAQLVSRGLNLFLTNELWTKVYKGDFWIANDQGFAMKNDPRANFVTGEDLTKDLPKVEALLCGGSLVKGIKNGDWTIVKGLHYDTPVSFDYVKAHPEFWIRGVYASGTGQPFRMLGDKYNGPAFIHPLIVNNNKGELRIESYKLQEWLSSEPPDPLKIYL
jgi:hypothetical protein